MKMKLFQAEMKWKHKSWNEDEICELKWKMKNIQAPMKMKTPN